MNAEAGSHPAHSTSHQSSDQAIIAFLAAGLDPPPSTAVMVAALANARREVAAHQARRRPIDAWLSSETRLRGIRENAAVLAALETPQRTQVAQSHRDQHPGRTAVLATLLAALPHPQDGQH
jgi:hypothetical protein